MDTTASRVQSFESFPSSVSPPPDVPTHDTPSTVEAALDTSPDHPWQQRLGAAVTRWTAYLGNLTNDLDRQQIPQASSPAYRGPRPDPVGLRPRSPAEMHGIRARISDTVISAIGVVGLLVYDPIQTNLSGVFKRKNSTHPAAPTPGPAQLADARYPDILIGAPIEYAPGRYRKTQTDDELATLLPEDVPWLPFGSPSSLARAIVTNVMGVHQVYKLPYPVRQTIENDVARDVLDKVTAVTIIDRIHDAYVARVITMTNNGSLQSLLLRMQQTPSSHIYSLTLNNGQIFRFHHPNHHRYREKSASHAR